MKTDILLPGLIAVVVHALVLSVAVPKTQDKNRRAYIYGPVSININHSQKAVVPMTPLQPPVQVPAKPASQESSRVPKKNTVISRQEVVNKKRSAVTKMAEKERSNAPVKETERAAKSDDENEGIKGSPLDQAPKDPGGRIESSCPVKAVSTVGHTPGVRQNPMEAPYYGNEGGQDNIVYARPRYKENPPPHYPERARRRGYEGKTILRVEVLKNGKPGRIEIEDSCGFRILDNAALESVSGWTFVPGTINGKGAKQWIRVPIRFMLQ